MLYLDHSATTPMNHEVISAMHEVMTTTYGNPSSLHTIGQKAERLVERAREVIGHYLQVNPEQIIFTSGGTESNNLAIKGVAYQLQHKGKHLITTRTEHPSVLNSFQQLEQEGFEVTYLSVDQDGRVDPDNLIRAIRNDTVLVSVMHVNHEVGTIQPIQEIGRLMKERTRCLFHVDAVQSVGKLPIHVENIDLLSISAHKIGGPKGAGVLVRAPQLNLNPLLSGGSQEFGLRAGTQNVPAIVGAAKAIRIALEKRQSNAGQMERVRSKILYGIQKWDLLQLNTPVKAGASAPHIVNFSCKNMKSEVLLRGLEQQGVYVSSRSACSSKDEKPSSVLLAMGLGRERAVSSVRISLSANETPSDATVFLQALHQMLNQLGLINQEWN